MSKRQQRHNIVEEDIYNILMSDISWEKFHGRSILVTGANGMLLSYVTLTLLQYRKEHPDSGLRIFALARSTERAKELYATYWNQDFFSFVEADICEPLSPSLRFDYIIHGASPADPKQFGADPAGVFLPNVMGLYQILQLAQLSKAEGVLFLSSGAIYGEMDESVSTIREDMCGSVDPLDERSCYAEGKRAGETLCAIWSRQHHVSTKIVRISHTFGPTMNMEADSRVFSEFVRNIVERKNIQMKSDGSAVRPFCYITDCVEGMFRVLLQGESGQAYNLAGDEYYSIHELAEMLCGLFPERELRVVRVDRDESDTYLAAKESAPKIVDTERLKMLGWRLKVTVQDGLCRTVMAIEESTSYNRK